MKHKKSKGVKQIQNAQMTAENLLSWGHDFGCVAIEQNKELRDENEHLRQRNASIASAVGHTENEYKTLTKYANDMEYAQQELEQRIKYSQREYDDLFAKNAITFDQFQSNKSELKSTK